MDSITSRHDTSLRRIVSLGIAVLLAIPTVAAAQSGGDRDRSNLSEQQKEKLNKLIDSARSDYKNERYEASVETLKEAYELYPNPAFFYRIALAYQKAGKPEPALRYFERYLEEEPDSSKRDEIEGRIAELERQIEQSGEASESAGDAPSESGDETAADETSDESAASASSSKGDETDVSGEPSSGPGAAPWIVGGVGGAAAISGITFGILSLSAKQRKERVMENNEMTREEAREQGLIERPRRFGTIALISGGVALAGLGTAAVLLATGGNSGQALGTDPSSASHAQFDVSPTRRGAGLLLRFEADF